VAEFLGVEVTNPKNEIKEKVLKKWGSNVEEKKPSSIPKAKSKEKSQKHDQYREEIAEKIRKVGKVADVKTAYGILQKVLQKRDKELKKRGSLSKSYENRVNVWREAFFLTLNPINEEEKRMIIEQFDHISRAGTRLHEDPVKLSEIVARRIVLEMMPLHSVTDSFTKLQYIIRCRKEGRSPGVDTLGYDIPPKAIAELRRMLIEMEPKDESEKKIVLDQIEAVIENRDQAKEGFLLSEKDLKSRKKKVQKLRFGLRGMIDKWLQ